MSYFTEKKFLIRMVFLLLGRINPSPAPQFPTFPKVHPLAIFWKVSYNTPRVQTEGGRPRADEYGPTFITVTDEDGREIVLEFVDALEYNGQQYQAFFPAETAGEDEDDPDNGLVILKVLHEDGEDLLSTLDSDEELDAVYDLFMESLFDEDGES